MSEPVIRPMREDDVPAVRRIAKAAWTPIYAYFRKEMGEDLYLREYPGDALERKADNVENFFRSHPEWMFVTDLDARGGDEVRESAYRSGPRARPGPPGLREGRLPAGAPARGVLHGALTRPGQLRAQAA